MNSIGFQKYVEEMNRQSLDKKPEHQGSVIDTSPRIIGGLARSRWAHSAHNNPQDGRVRQSPAASLTLFQSNANVSHPKEPIYTQPSGWDDPESTASQIEEQSGQHLKLETFVLTSGEESHDTQKNGVSLTDVVPDPRAHWPTETGFANKTSQSVASQFQEWDRRSQKKSSDDISSLTQEEKAVPQYVFDFIDVWRRRAHVVKADFLSQGGDLHEDCDVDTYGGVLMEPVEHPVTKMHELISRDQLEMTSGLLMRQYVAAVARKDPHRRAQRKAEKQARAAAEAAAAAEPEIVAEPLPNQNEVQIPCHLRPAVESDMEAVAAIYNQEILDGYRMMDTKPVMENDFRRIYGQCLTEKMPFVVAVEGWHGTMDTDHARVLGFALVTAVSRGIAGSYDTLSRRGGKLLIIVRPECRRKRIGTALIDIIITNCTGWHMSKGGYQFVNFTHDWISSEFGTNPRKWWYLELEVMIRSAENEVKAREGEEFQWIWNFLEAEFNLLLKHYDEKCFYHEQKMQWLDKITFRRDCRTRGE
ncbi:hypothetical protein F5B22DRAFT_655668 [Xylaria bambusicola]|uniref:uncharacterized protein n=1 Tax=Xylaria bambusicola TaxID=326684 RepID=UPI002008B116|nr:uncharacterized protein F5B22DRAFT_655668 [Xylaria bambusicola]KAI0526517.1 hypothetical protein F5B22DRAFT_655668 [Xylaria bambusicola]